LLGRQQRELVLMAARYEIFGELTLRRQGCVRLSDHVLTLFDRRQVIDLGRDFAVRNATIRRLEEAVFVGPRVHRQRVDETDIRTFRRLDRANATVVCRMDVAHFKTGALTREAAWSKRRDAALVGDL
jgi:hypothetical protein